MLKFILNTPRIRELTCICMAFGAAWPSAAADLRVAVTENLDYPLNIFDKDRQLKGGLLKEFTDNIAGHIGAKPVYRLYSRRRVDAAVIGGDSDLLCYTSPKWMETPQAVAWTIPAMPQVERVVVLRGSPLPEAFQQDLKGKRIAVQIGYHYALIQALFDSGQARRMDMTDVPGMFRLLERGGADALISSESEIEGYFKNFPDKRHLYQASKKPFSIVQTQCALSYRSRWKLAPVNRAIQRMQESGELEKMMRDYGLSTH
ncbi:MAG: transporter substrate-binding domain-containing protein [Burkholderiales bacterium]|nr:transporter substrate-binding domain-containing protein [Burkholderiales bacterium]